MRRRRSSAAKPSAVRVNHDDGSKSSIWWKFVGSMRPLHLQSNVSPLYYSESATTLPSPKPDSCGGYASDFVAEEERYSPSPPSSCYSSAVGLNELLGSEEDSEKQDRIVEEKCNNEEHIDGDEMIDAKAEEFIAQFYQQMRLQRMDSVDLRYEERRFKAKDKMGKVLHLTKEIINAILQILT
ncbi:hypothetical protein CR513_09694, partial [Mucuna pruriens]